MTQRRTRNVTTEKVSLESADILADRLAALRQIVPEAFAADGQVDFDRLKAALGDVVEGETERYRFTWAGKQDALRLLQAPSRAALVPCPDESIHFGSTGNVFIEGENLEVLKLLYRAYFGRVKMIYIDPPYNTGNDFIYPDDFSEPLAHYLRLTGQVDEKGAALTSNREASGRFHSRWLSMMFPRLFIARQLLRDDGVIFVSIDDHEVSNLRLLMNEVFGEENFLATIIWHKMDSPKNTARHFSEDHDYVLAFARDAEKWRPDLLDRSEAMIARYRNPDNDPRGPWLLSDLAARNFYAQGRYAITTPSGKVIEGPPAGSYWRISKSRFEEMCRDNRIWWGTGGDNRPGIKRFLSEVREGVVPQTYWSWKQVGSTRNAKQELSQLMEASAGEDLFVTPKPTTLVERMCEIAADQNAIILDFFAGSGCTAHSVLNRNRKDGGNRKFILVQLPETTGRMDYRTIADVCKERIRKAVKKLRKEEKSKLHFKDRDQPEDLGFSVFRLAASNFRQWRGEGIETGEHLLAELEQQLDPLPAGFDPQAVIYEVALKEGLSLTSRISPVPDVPGNTVYRVDDADKGQHFFICLDEHLSNAAWKALNLTKDDLFICRDHALDDTKAANLMLQCRLKTL